MNYVSNLLIIKTNCVCRKDFKRNDYNIPRRLSFHDCTVLFKDLLRLTLELNNPFCFTNIVINIFYFQDLKNNYLY